MSELRLRQHILTVVDGPRELAALRRRVRTLLTGASDKDLSDALLVCNEIATMAWLAARQPCTVRLLWMADGTLRSEVDIPEAAPPQDWGTSAALLDGIAAGWGTQHGRHGVRLWADVVIVPTPEHGQEVPDHESAVDAVHVHGRARAARQHA